MVIRMAAWRLSIAAVSAALAFLPFLWSNPSNAEPPIQVAAVGDEGMDGNGGKSWRPGPLATPYGNYLAARHAERIHDFALSARLFEQTLRVAPTDPVLLNRTLHQMVAAGRMDDAVPIARRYLELRPQSVIAGLVLAAEAIRADRLDDALERLKSVPGGGLGGYAAPLVRGWILAGQEKADEALEALAPLGKRRGLKPLHDLHAALILDAAGERDRAMELFRGFAESKRLYTRQVELTGAFLEREGEGAAAQKLYENYLKQVRDSLVIEASLARAKSGKGKPQKEIATAATGTAEGLFDLAQILDDQNADEIAIMIARIALYLHPRFALAQTLIGDLLIGMERYGDAVKAYDRVDRKSLRSWQARLRAADSLSRMEKVEPALARFSAMAEERSDRPDALIAKGDLLRFKKRYGEALKAYEQAFARIPKIERRHWSLYYSRGITLERSKEWPRAEKDFLKALELQPDQPFVLNYLGYSWVDRGENLKRALVMIEKAVRLRPNDGFIVDSLGWAHYRLGGFAKAVTYLERAIMLSPQDAAINDHLGDAYWRVGRRMEARFQWRRALGLDPEPDTIDGIRKKLAEGLKEPAAKKKAPAEETGRRGG